jgi:serine/threonine-protein kinase RsbT
MSVYDQVLRELRQHISAINARSVIDRALIRAGVLPAELDAQLWRALPEIERGAAVFVGAEAARVALKPFAAGSSGKANVSLPVATEQDLAQARSTARTMCGEAHLGTFLAQTVVTVVSELGRNMVMYAGGGVMELESAAGGVTITARDRGPGIPNLPDIFAGSYKSKSGLGAGLRGVRKLARKFDIESGPQGTTIRVEVGR